MAFGGIFAKGNSKWGSITSDDTINAHADWMASLTALGSYIGLLRILKPTRQHYFYGVSDSSTVRSCEEAGL